MLPEIVPLSVFERERRRERTRERKRIMEDLSCEERMGSPSYIADFLDCLRERGREGGRREGGRGKKRD